MPTLNLTCIVLLSHNTVMVSLLVSITLPHMTCVSPSNTSVTNIAMNAWKQRSMTIVCFKVLQNVYLLFGSRSGAYKNFFRTWQWHLTTFHVKLKNS